MKATFENSPLIKYCLNKPITLTFFLVALFVTMLSVDQSINNYKTVTEKNSSFRLSHLNTNYVAWSSTNPSIISQFKGVTTESDSTSDLAYFASFKTSARSLIHYAELQLRLIKRAVNFVL